MGKKDASAAPKRASADANGPLCSTPEQNNSRFAKDDGGGRFWVLRSLRVLFLCIFWIPIIGIPSMAVIVVAPFLGLTYAQRLTWRHAVLYFKLTLRHSGVAYTVLGLENLDPAANYFFACNHESIYDIPLAFACFPVFISRGGGEGTGKAIAQLDKGLNDLKKRPRSVLLFPEGTRSESGVVQPFKKGGLVMAIQAGMPVVPVAICNSVAIVGHRIETFRPVHHCSVAVVVGKPIDTAKLTYNDREALCDQVQKEVVRLKEMHRLGEFDALLNHKVEPFLSCWRNAFTGVSTLNGNGH